MCVQTWSQMLVNPTPLLRQRNPTNHYDIDVNMIGNVGIVREHRHTRSHWQPPRSICKDLRPLIASLLPASARRLAKIFPCQHKMSSTISTDTNHLYKKWKQRKYGKSHHPTNGVLHFIHRPKVDWKIRPWSWVWNWRICNLPRGN